MALFVDLLPMMLGAALGPVWIVAILLILQSGNGLVKAIAFLVGVTTVRLLQGLVFGVVLAQAALSDQGGEPRLLTATLLTVLGVLLWVSAVKTLLNEPDPDAPPPKWMAALDQSTPLQLLGTGMLLTVIAPKLWVFTLSAIGTIRGANLASLGEGVQAFLLYVAGAQALLVLPMVAVAIAPGPSSRLLRSATAWLMRYSRPISLGVYVLFGSLFLGKGLSGLMG